MRTNTVKAALKAGRPQVGTWLSLGSPLAARYMAQVGFDWLNVDIEHSSTTWEQAALMFGAIADAGGTPFARVPFNSLENAKRALDNGAFGIVFPMCCSVEEARSAVAACKYPPVGERSVGGSLHAINFKCSPGEYYARANDEILVVVQAEHITAVEQADEIFAVPGVDVVFVGPNDLLASMNKTPSMDCEDPEFVAALRHIRETARKHGVAPGIHVANVEAARRRIDEGWQFIAISSELGFMQQGGAAVVKSVIGERSGGSAARY
ncbi:MAG TPA: aldolase/citrate lyase family protein [Chthonomonadaceae bacterium]|nr:aldolase/citrate lyase family protein [Chthonomonadaceae bacterium]